MLNVRMSACTQLNISNKSSIHARFFFFFFFSITQLKSRAHNLIDKKRTVLPTAGRWKQCLNGLKQFVISFKCIVNVQKNISKYLFDKHYFFEVEYIVILELVYL